MAVNLVETEIKIAARLLPATFTAPGLSEEEFLAICDQFPDAFLEYTADGTVIIMPPTDPESGDRVHNIQFQLGSWAQATRRGRVTGPDTGFYFPNGARRSPDVAWRDVERWETARKNQPRRRFPVFAPDFAIEVRSIGNPLRDLRDKMEEYIANGVQLAWLIAPFERTVTIYRPEREPEVLHHPATVSGEGPVAGFTLNLQDIYAS